MLPVVQHFPRPQIEDIPAAVRHALAPVVAKVSRGARIAITGSSRGITNQALVLRTCVELLLEVGAKPFVLPGMGSHGGATVEGQRGILDAAGIREETLGCPVEATMDTEQVGITSTGFPVFQDRLACAADGVLLVNRVKPHTGFTDRVESGICKMMVIGLGKQAGASRIHQQGLHVPMGRMILEASRILLESNQVRYVGALGLVENPFHETALIESLRVDSHEALVADEHRLLEQAYTWLPRIPFEQLDGLIVDELGKDISGTGMDTNVIARKEGLEHPRIGAIFVRGISAKSCGNANGIGMADVIPAALVEKIDFAVTYMNAFTSKRLMGIKLPLLAANEAQAVQVLMNFRAAAEPESVRLMRIRNTICLDRFWVSESLAEAVKAHPHLEALGPAQPLCTNPAGELLLPEL